jgi:hypothetical protein
MKKKKPPTPYRAKRVKNPRPRPNQIMVMMVADTTDGVHSTRGPFEGSVDELMAHVESLLQFEWTRSIHIYMPETPCKICLRKGCEGGCI